VAASTATDQDALDPGAMGPLGINDLTQPVCCLRLADAPRPAI
jgi:hypothetical protein